MALTAVKILGPSITDLFIAGLILIIFYFAYLRVKIFFSLPAYVFLKSRFNTLPEGLRGRASLKITFRGFL